jgi:hypothetical protein
MLVAEYAGPVPCGNGIPFSNTALAKPGADQVEFRLVAYA